MLSVASEKEGWNDRTAPGGALTSFAASTTPSTRTRFPIASMHGCCNRWASVEQLTGKSVWISPASHVFGGRSRR